MGTSLSLTVAVGVSRTRFSKTVADKAHSRLRLCFASAKNDLRTPNISSTICVLQLFASRTCANHSLCMLNTAICIFHATMMQWMGGQLLSNQRLFAKKSPSPIVFSCGNEFGILESDFCTKQHFTGCQINFGLHRSRTKQETRLSSRFPCSTALHWYIFMHYCPFCPSYD